eukprot:2669600-Karenia_brevis.AAC.1
MFVWDGLPSHQSLLKCVQYLGQPTNTAHRHICLAQARALHAPHMATQAKRALSDARGTSIAKLAQLNGCTGKEYSQA